MLDSPAEPQNLRCEIELPGQLDPEQLRTAAVSVAADEPRARVRLARWRLSDRDLAWEVADALDCDPVEFVEICDLESFADARDELVGRPFNLDRSPLWRLGVLQRADHCHLILAAHHAAFDGQGSVHLVRMLAAAYAGEPKQPAERRSPRGRTGNPTARLAALTRLAASVTRRTARVSPEDAEPGAPGVHVDGIRLDAATTARLSSPNRDGGVIDLLLAGAIVAIDRWNAAHGQKGGRIALLHAVGTPVAPGGSPLGNAWLPTVIALSAAERARSETVAIVARRRRAALAGIPHQQPPGERRAPSLPVWLKRLAGAVHPLTGQRLAESAAVTSLGRVRPFDFGDGLRSVAFWFDGPTRLPKGLFICPTMHGDELHVALRSARAQLGRSALRRFGELYVHTLLELNSG